MKRLFDDPTLADELRAELERSRQAGRDYDVAGKLPQLREAFEHKTLDAELSEPGSSAGLGGVASPSLGISPWVGKLVLCAGLAGAIGYLAWPKDAAPARPDAGQGAIAPQPSAATTTATTLEPTPHPAPQPRDVDAERALAAPSQPAPAQPAALAREEPARAAAEPGPSAPELAPRTSRREIAQVVRIRALLERDPAAAARLARRGEREFPRGVLGEERRALWVLALAKSGETQAAEQKAREFFARHPQSPMRELVEAALKR